MNTDQFIYELENAISGTLPTNCFCKTDSYPYGNNPDDDSVITEHSIYATGFVHYFDEGVKISGNFAKPVLIVTVEEGAEEFYKFQGDDFHKAINEVIGVELA